MSLELSGMVTALLSIIHGVTWVLTVLDELKALHKLKAPYQLKALDELKALHKLKASNPHGFYFVIVIVFYCYLLNWENRLLKRIFPILRYPRCRSFCVFNVGLFFINNMRFFFLLPSPQ